MPRRYKANDVLVGQKKSIYDARGSRRSMTATKGAVCSDVYFESNRCVLVDQSGAHQYLKGAPKAAAYMNHVRGGSRFEMRQNNVRQFAVSGGSNSTTALLCVDGTRDFGLEYSGSYQRVDGRKGGRNSTAAGIVIEGNATVKIVQRRSVSVVTGGR